MIFAGADIEDYRYIEPYLCGHCFIICCDGGFKHLKNMGLEPDIIIGDMDSIESDVMHVYHDRLLKYNVDKDYTDLELCIEYVIGSKYAELLIFGAIGLRADHSYVNVQLLTKCLENNIQAKIIDSLNIIQLINGDTSLHAKKGQLISIIPLTSTVSNISTKGLKYVLHNEDLRIGSSRGVSNVFLGDDASISFNDGLLLVILCRDK